MKICQPCLNFEHLSDIYVFLKPSFTDLYENENYVLIHIHTCYYIESNYKYTFRGRISIVK